MDDGIAHLGSTIAAHLREWDSTPAFVELAVFGTDARSFLAEYEAAREHQFSTAERRLCSASFAYSCAYTARCGHALGSDERDAAGTFQHLVWTERENLLDL